MKVIAICILILVFNYSCFSDREMKMNQIFEYNYSFKINDTVQFCMPVLDISGSKEVVYRYSYPYSTDYLDMDDSLELTGVILSKELFSLEPLISKWKKDLIYRVKILKSNHDLAAVGQNSDTFSLGIYYYARNLVRPQ